MPFGKGRRCLRDKTPVPRDDGSFLIPMTQGAFAIVDKCDVEIVSRYSWCKDRRKNQTYAKAKVDGKMSYMHRLILPHASVVDHANGNGLDNRRCNLREATVAQNILNSKSVYGESKYKGVSRSSSKLNPWRAGFKLGDDRIEIGIYADEESAARAYNEVAKRYGGEFAHLNDVPDGPITVRNRFTDGYSDKRTGYKGVLANRHGTYDVRIWLRSQRRTVSGGVYKCPIEAALAYDKLAVELYGPDFPTNRSLNLLAQESAS